MKLREIPFEIESRIAEYGSTETTDERRLEIEEELEALDFTVEDKAAHYADLMAHYNSQAETLRQEELRLGAWRKSLEGMSSWLKRNLETNLLILNKRKIETDFWKFSFRRSESMVVRAEDILPEKFMIPVPATVKPDNAEIKKALSASLDKSKEWYGEFESEEIPGAVLIVKQNLQIR